MENVLLGLYNNNLNKREENKCFDKMGIDNKLE